MSEISGWSLSQIFFFLCFGYENENFYKINELWDFSDWTTPPPFNEFTDPLELPFRTYFERKLCFWTCTSRLVQYSTACPS